MNREEHLKTTTNIHRKKIRELCLQIYFMKCTFFPILSTCEKETHTHIYINTPNAYSYPYNFTPFYRWWLYVVLVLLITVLKVWRCFLCEKRDCKYNSKMIIIFAHFYSFIHIHTLSYPRSLMPHYHALFNSFMCLLFALWRVLIKTCWYSCIYVCVSVCVSLCLWLKHREQRKKQNKKILSLLSIFKRFS